MAKAIFKLAKDKMGETRAQDGWMIRVNSTTALAREHDVVGMVMSASGGGYEWNIGGRNYRVYKLPLAKEQAQAICQSLNEEEYR